MLVTLATVTLGTVTLATVGLAIASLRHPQSLAVLRCLPRGSVNEKHERAYNRDLTSL
jgi:hypothetical protein